MSALQAARLGSSGVEEVHMAKNIVRTKTKAAERVSDQEIWLAIRYLDSDTQPETSDIAVIAITLVALLSIVGIVWLLFRICGL